MCCFSHLCLDPWQTWISCFHLHLWTFYLQNIIPPVWSMLSFSGHHPLTQPHFSFLRDTSTLCFCLSFWEWSLCSIYRLFFRLFYSSPLTQVSLRLDLILSCARTIDWKQRRVSDAHLKGFFPCMFRGFGVSEQGGPEADPGHEVSDLHLLLSLFWYHKHFLVYSVINCNIMNSKHSSLSRK